MRKKKKGDTPVGKRERRERRTKKGKEEIRNRERKGKGREGKEGWKEERNNERKKQKGEARKLRSRVGSRPAALFAKVCHKEWLAFKACSELLVATRLILQAPVPAITFALKQRTRRQNATRLGKTYQNRPEAQNDRVDEICNWSGAGFEQGPGQVLEQLLEQVPGQGPEQVLEQVLEQTTSRGGSHKFRSALKLQALGVLILNGVALDRRFCFAGAAAVLMLAQVLVLDRRFGFAGAAAVLMQVPVLALDRRFGFAGAAALMLVLDQRFVLLVPAPRWF